MALISKLPRKEKKLAQKRRREYVQRKGLETERMQIDSLISAFDWSETPEGDAYWNELDDNKDYE